MTVSNPATRSIGMYIEGVRDLRQAGLQKVKQGLTSLEEVMAVTNE